MQVVTDVPMDYTEFSRNCLWRGCLPVFEPANCWRCVPFEPAWGTLYVPEGLPADLVVSWIEHLREVVAPCSPTGMRLRLIPVVGVPDTWLPRRLREVDDGDRW